MISVAPSLRFVLMTSASSCAWTGGTTAATMTALFESLFTGSLTAVPATWLAGFSRPKRRINPKRVHLVNEHHEVVTEHLCQRLIDLDRLGFAPERIAKLRLIMLKADSTLDRLW